MIKIRSKERDGSEVLVNVNAINYIVPSLDGGSVIHFQTSFLVALNSIEEIESKIKVSRTHIQELSPQSTLLTESITLDTESVLSDGYPEHLPRLPTGNVDKRTNAYKDYIASKGW